MPNQFIDALNNPISVGDRILYPGQRGSSSAFLNFGTVDEIIELPLPSNPWLDPKRAYKLRVIRDPDSWDRKQGKTTGRRVQVTNVNNVVVITGLVKS